MNYFGGGYPGLYLPLNVEVIEAPVRAPEWIAVEIPMRVVTGGTTRPVAVVAAAALWMRVAATVPVPLGRGMADHAEIPMRVPSRLVVERSH